MASILFFSSDLAETAQIRRIRSVRAAGHEVSSISMRKPGPLTTMPPDWPDLGLGEIANERLGRRIRLAVRGAGRIWAGRKAVGAADLIVARNMDMVALALLARRMSGRRIPVVYECLDVHGLLTRPDLKGRVARWIERRLLKKSALLVVSSPGFLQEYFGKVQGHRGPSLLLENKLWFPGAPAPRPTVARPPLHGRPLVLGWVGAIRCRPSLDLLLAVAERMGDRLRVHVRGVVHEHALPDFHGRIAAHPNVSYGGPYAYPDGLAEVYAGCDIVWAQDLWQKGANSDWLLPNRIYEASWFGCPSLAVAGTQTAAKVAAEGLGWVIDAARPEVLAGRLATLTEADLSCIREGLLAREEGAFRLTRTEIDAVIARGLGGTA